MFEMYVNLRFCERAISLFASEPEFQSVVFSSPTGSCLPTVVNEFSMYHLPVGPLKPCENTLTQGNSSPSTLGRKRITAFALPALSRSSFQNLLSS